MIDWTFYEVFRFRCICGKQIELFTNDIFNILELFPFHCDQCWQVIFVQVRFPGTVIWFLLKWPCQKKISESFILYFFSNHNEILFFTDAQSLANLILNETQLEDSLAASGIKLSSKAMDSLTSGTLSLSKVKTKWQQSKYV